MDWQIWIVLDIYIYILQRSAKIILAVNLGCDSIHANPKQSQRSISLAYEFAVIGCTFGWPATYISFHHVQTVFPGEIRLFPSFQSDHQHKQPFRLLKQFSRIDAESRSHGFVGKFHNFGTIEGCWVLGRWDCYMFVRWWWTFSALLALNYPALSRPNHVLTPFLEVLLGDESKP